MPSLYLTRSGGILRFQNNCFVAEAPGRPSIAVPEFRVDRVVAFGPVHLTQPAVARLLQKRAEVHFLTRFGRPRGRLCPADDARVDVRLSQYQAFCDDGYRVLVARDIVAAKIANGRKLLMRCQRNHPAAGLKEAIASLASSVANALKTEGLAELRGVEGYAANCYFEALGGVLREGVPFDGRNRRPPKDPVNALLSLGYTLLGGEIQGLLATRGLDPYLGFYHQPRRGMPALAQDILEEFRAPVVDRLVLALFNRREVSADDFAAGPKGGFRLKERPLKLFLRAYERALEEEFGLWDGRRTSFRKQAAAQCAIFRRAVEKTTEYSPFRWERS